ncbi:MAG: hypothetical protein GY729_17920, partial [Desulfobacteraceae bacterium]|nr:hypothetical protein [Desulfobacteraceae bacterium]
MAFVLQKMVQTNESQHIYFFLEKHGAFYHPIRLCVQLNELTPIYFVLNGAVSKPGLSLMEDEYGLLTKLSQKFSFQFIPQVYATGSVSMDDHAFGFFLGEWFKGYNEFHITDDAKEKKIVIWGSDGKHTYLPLDKASTIYEKIATILTGYYDIVTFEQIFPWHHAAGDFIVKKLNSGFDVKMVTIRGYSSQAA